MAKNSDIRTVVGIKLNPDKPIKEPKDMQRVRREPTLDGQVSMIYEVGSEPDIPHYKGMKNALKKRGVVLTLLIASLQAYAFITCTYVMVCKIF